MHKKLNVTANSMLMIFAGSIVKQADVILMGFPFMWNMTVATRCKDLEIYGHVSSHSLGHVHRESKKGDTILLSISLLNVD